MPETLTMYSCPTCQKQFDPNQGKNSKPFCSERCRLIDLGDWLDESYRIPDRSSGHPFLPDDDPD